MFVVGGQVAGAGAQDGQGAVEVGIDRAGPVGQRGSQAVDGATGEAMRTAAAAIGRGVGVALAGKARQAALMRSVNFIF